VLSCSSDETSAPVTPPPAPIAKYTITFSAGDGGSVSTTGGEYEKGQTVTVTATPLYADVIQLIPIQYHTKTKILSLQ